jgi:dTDP-4-amino-4,6-dideoxygalactose transaminase
MKIPFVDLQSQYKSIKSLIDKSIQDVIDTTSFISGPEVKKFESKFSSKIGSKHCISVANGTDAIYIILKMLNISYGDEVITTASSWISTSETISQTGAKPVFVDIDDFYTIDSKKIEEKITHKTKAIIVVHLYGQSADLNAILQITKKYNLFLIEDCAQSHFTKYFRKNVGTIGHASTFSFYPGKNLGAYGDAGCIITNDDELANKCRMYANHGALIKHQHMIEGINSRLDTIQAAILNIKLDYIDFWNECRSNNAKLYIDLLKEIPQVQVPKIRNNTFHSFHLFVIRVTDRDNLQLFLKENGIETAIHYPTPLPFLKAYDYLQNKQIDFPLSVKHHIEILSLPMYPELSREEIIYIVSCIKKFYNL